MDHLQLLTKDSEWICVLAEALGARSEFAASSGSKTRARIPQALQVDCVLRAKASTSYPAC